jgi:hypothetical protein
VLICCCVAALVRPWWQGRGAARRCCWWHFFPCWSWRRGELERGVLFSASSGRRCSWRCRVLPLLLDLAPRWRQWQQERGFVRPLGLDVGEFLQRLVAACSVTPSGHNGCTATGHVCFAQAVSALSRRPAPSGFVPSGGAVAELEDSVGILEKMKEGPEVLR